MRIPCNIKSYNNCLSFDLKKAFDIPLEKEKARMSE